MTLNLGVCGTCAHCTIPNLSIDTIPTFEELKTYSIYQLADCRLHSKKCFTIRKSLLECDTFRHYKEDDEEKHYILNFFHNILISLKDKINEFKKKRSRRN
jgi:hypothetical protein